MKLVLMSCLFLSACTVGAQTAPPGGQPLDTNIVNTPGVLVTNDTSAPFPVRSVVKRIPVSCVVATFQTPGNEDATCVGPDGAVTPVAADFFLVITDVIATSQRAAGTAGQAVVRVSSRNQGGTQFGAGVPLILKAGETQSLHYQSPDQVLPAGRIPTASVGINFGDVFPVEVHLTGYLVAEDDLSRW